ncbi:MAG: S46 family peptidase [Bacteroidales bacterium]|nr:S46 family peptidase [Bacteroidales bacterium]
MKRKSPILLIVLFILPLLLKAGEGMWLPLWLGELNEKEMQAMGLKISAKDIYDENNSSLKDAVVIFGGGCTGGVVSDQGLLLTNHHCGYGSIQRHSSIEHDYLTDGFWAMNHSEELPCQGLTVTFLIRMEDVTKKMMTGITDDMTEEARQNKIKSNREKIETEVTKGTHYEAVVKPFFEGNQYILFINEIFRDVRLVGAPPSNIGKFGGDTDNWMWPRHTGDFSIFRIYADKDNKPADYSKDNVPYTPKKFFEISLQGVQEGDFTFVFGYPGTTNEYLPSYAINETVNVTNPIRIDMRTKRLDIMKAAMNSDPKIRIQYSSKVAGIANGWKKWQGESGGILHVDGIGQKQNFEKEFTKWEYSNRTTHYKYGKILSSFAKNYEESQDFVAAYTYFRESVNSVELLSFARRFRKAVELASDKTSDPAELYNNIYDLQNSTTAFFKDYNADIDQKVCAAMFTSYLQNVSAEFVPMDIINLNSKYKGDMTAFAHDLFAKSMFDNPTEMEQLLSNFNSAAAKKIAKDPAYQLIINATDFVNHNLIPAIKESYASNDSLQRLYMKAQMEMQPDRRFYPDANFTMRITYGNVAGFKPADAVTYKHFTTLDGIMEKENPDIYDYVVEKQLKTLYKKRDYGRYGDKDGKMHVGFVATNHTTGGNSGSPVLDANGRLIGLNFDRCWEGTMSDLIYNPDICRNISLDIRYCLFIIDKFAGAKHLVDEMTIVE